MDILKRRSVKDQRFYSPEYLLLLETHLDYIRSNVESEILTITPQQTYKFQGDFYGLLRELKIPKEYHQLVCRYNNLRSSSDYKGDSNTIIVPNFNSVDLLVKLLYTKVQ